MLSLYINNISPLYNIHSMFPSAYINILRWSAFRWRGAVQTLTRAFLQEDDLWLGEEVGAGDDHLLSPADQTAGQAGLLHLGQFLSRALSWGSRSRRRLRRGHTHRDSAQCNLLHGESCLYWFTYVHIGLEWFIVVYIVPMPLKAVHPYHHYPFIHTKPDIVSSEIILC